jgi:type II secretory ATPase GspE/PulE/Tfp pilus assembly ATPase PilB-like protein
MSNQEQPDKSTTDPERALSREVLAGSNFSAKDLALCSHEDARSFITSADALSLLVLPLALTRTPKRISLHLAASQGGRQKEHALRFLTGVAVSITVVPEDVLRDAIALAYLGSESRLSAHLEKVSTKKEENRSESDYSTPPPSGDAAQFISALIEFAAVRGASDLHLVPTDEGALIKMRIDGQLMTQKDKPYAREFHEQVVSRLKVIANLNITSKMVPHDGAFSFSLGSAVKSARISTLPTVYGESVVVRFLGADGVPQISKLGMEPMALVALRGAIERTEGIILLTGPTGSGKTTTMYSLVAELDRRGRNVVTVEDPVETPIAGMVQVQVATEQGLDYPRAIRSVLRHDPDVLLIGEMRDGISASMALDAASTGHLTVSSLHVGSALHTLGRLEVLGVSRARAISPLSLVINQRLLPRLCRRCKQQREEKSGFVTYQPQGCASCHNTGFSGRVLVTEALDLQSLKAKEAAYAADNPRDLLELLPAGAFIPWTEALQYHLTRGDVSLEQVDQFLASEWE